MNLHAIAASVLLQLAAQPEAGASVGQLAEACGATVEDTAAACALLHRWALAHHDADGSVALACARGGEATTTVLLVENTDAVAHVLVALLASEGYRVLLCSAVEPALRLLEFTTVQLVIADSFSTAARAALKRLEPLRAAALPARTLLFTAHRDLTDAEARAAGYAGILPKPFDIDALLASVGVALELRPD